MLTFVLRNSGGKNWAETLSNWLLLNFCGLGLARTSSSRAPTAANRHTASNAYLFIAASAERRLQRLEYAIG